jgi:hypothetical protein
MVALEALQPHEFDGFTRELGPAGPVHAMEFQEQLHVLLHGAPRQQGGVLEHVSEVVAIDRDVAGRLRDQLGRDLQQRGLATAGRTDHGDEFAVPNIEGDVDEGGRSVGERLADLAETQGRWGLGVCGGRGLLGDVVHGEGRY